MTKVNLNELAVMISKLEHGKVQMNITEIKEVLKCWLILNASGVYIKNESVNSFVKRHKIKIDEVHRMIKRGDL
jgi:hypothetical protein